MAFLYTYILNLRKNVANLALLRLRTFGWHFLTEIWWRRAQKHFSEQGHHIPILLWQQHLFLEVQASINFGKLGRGDRTLYDWQIISISLPSENFIKLCFRCHL